MEPIIDVGRDVSRRLSRFRVVVAPTSVARRLRCRVAANFAPPPLGRQTASARPTNNRIILEERNEHDVVGGGGRVRVRSRGRVGCRVTLRCVGAAVVEDRHHYAEDVACCSIFLDRSTPEISRPQRHRCHELASTNTRFRFRFTFLSLSLSALFSDCTTVVVFLDAA